MADKWKPEIVEAGPARLFAACFFDEGEFYLKARKKLQSLFGAIDYESQSIGTDFLMPLYTNAARNTLRIVSFKRPVGRDELVSIRKKTLSLEIGLQQIGRPAVEIDPGYVSEFNVVRTSLMDNFHHIYLYNGIFAEALLYFENATFRPFAHTPEMYRQDAVRNVFNDLRLIHVSES